MKIPYSAFKSLNQLLTLHTGLAFKVSRQTSYNYRFNGVPAERFAALLFCLRENGINYDSIYKVLHNLHLESVVDDTLDHLTEISF